MSRPRDLSSCAVDGCERSVYGHGWCQMHYQRWRKHGDPLVVASKAPKNPRRNQLEDVWKYVQIGAPDECWPWLGARRRRGYGSFTLRCRSMVAHRAAFQAATGIDPGEKLVCHSCDNPPCCNPAHLFLGTETDNVRDMLAKSRHGGPRARLTVADVLTIRELLATGRTQVAIAAEFGVSSPHISRIARGLSWTVAA